MSAIARLNTSSAGMPLALAVRRELSNLVVRFLFRSR
jgi:hypothetical protein